jgi:hypothetical protein
MKAITILALLAMNLAAADSKSSIITVRVVPEVAISVKGMESVGVRIRLSPMAKAQLWIGDNCSNPPAASHIIGQSGTYEVPMALLPGVGRMVCLISAVDGLIETAPLLAPRLADSVRCADSTCSAI